MKQLSNFMLDIETFGTDNDSIILSVGCVKFGTDFVANTSSPHLYMELNTKTQDRTVSMDTVRWWTDQVSNTRAKIPGDTPDSMSLPAALEDLSNFIELHSTGTTPVIWCKGPQFDMAMLEHAYKQCGIDVPWKYNSARDLRTVLKITSAPRYPASHNALEDCFAQIKQLSEAFLYLGLDLPIREV
jgi:hypothetical protein